MWHRRPGTRVAILGAFVLAVALGLVVLLTAASPAFAFPDVPAGHAYEQAINGLARAGIIGGYTDGRFGLNDTVKRAQFAKMIIGAMGIDPGTSTTTRFTDLGAPDANGYPHKFVQAAYDYGITKGTNTAQTLFSPSNPIRRDQVITMIVRAALSQNSSSLLDPPSGAATLFAGVGEPHGENVRIAEFNGLLKGLVGVDQGWDVTANATRGEVAQMLWNLIPGDFTVLADGTGDYPTIEDAIANVGPRDWIHLGPGTFTLKGTLSARYPLRFVGVEVEGAQTTTVRYAGTLIDAESTLVAVARVRLVSTSTSIASNVVSARDCMVILEDCDLSGAHRADEKRGSGLYLSATSGGIISHCSLHDNDLHGIGVEDSSSAVIQDSDCSDNAQGGVTFFHDATGVVRDCTCSSNGSHGISVRDRAEVTLEGNQCSDNAQGGVTFFHDATGVVRDCTCSSNGLNGVGVQDRAEVALEGNQCFDNVHSGVTFFHDATGVVRDCTCSSNGSHGISVQDRAEVTVEGNQCSDNAQGGVTFFDESSGTVQGNECTGNKWGLYIDTNATPSVGTNVLRDNTTDYYKK